MFLMNFCTMDSLVYELCDTNNLALTIFPLDFSFHLNSGCFPKGGNCETWQPRRQGNATNRRDLHRQNRLFSNNKRQKSDGQTHAVVRNTMYRMHRIMHRNIEDKASEEVQKLSGSDQSHSRCFNILSFIITSSTCVGPSACNQIIFTKFN